MRELLAAGIERRLAGRRSVTGDDGRGAIGRGTEYHLVGLRQSITEANGDDHGAGNAHGPADASWLVSLVSSRLFMVVGGLQGAAVSLIVAVLAAAVGVLMQGRVAIAGGGHRPIGLLQ